MKKLLAIVALLFGTPAVAQVPDMSPVPTTIYTAGAGAGNYDVSVNDGRLTAPTYVQPPEVNDGLDTLTGGPLVFASAPNAMYSGATEEQGAFRMICSAGINRTDDPVVYPGQVGRSHRHNFFGNLGVNAFSTYSSLRSTGKSTCINMLNRSSYWQPTMVNGQGWNVNPFHEILYYKRIPAISGRCTVRVNGQRINYCLPSIPRGLRFIFGRDLITGGIAGGFPEFVCLPPSSSGRPTTRGEFIDTVAAVCQPGDELGAFVQSPECWDGKNPDSPNHRSHMSDPTGDGKTTPRCPTSHPFILPTYSDDTTYIVDSTVSTWKLSSDFMANNGAGCAPNKRGCSLHMDVFFAWNDSIMREWIANCIEAWRSCSAGELGTGRQMNQDTTLPAVLPYDKNPMPMATDAGSAHVMHTRQ